MAETKLIRDHHLLTRNLKLNGNYISNDGGDEGIGVSDVGLVSMYSTSTEPIFTFNPADAIFKIASPADYANDYFSIDVDADGETTIKTTNNGDSGDLHFDIDTGDIIFKQSGTLAGSLSLGSGTLELQCNNDLTLNPGNGDSLVMDIDSSSSTGGKVLLDFDKNNTTAETHVAFHLDYDRIGSVSSGTDINTALHVDMSTSQASTTQNTIGIDVDIVNDGAGGFNTTTNTGMNISTTGADINYALITSGGNVGIGNSAPGSDLEISKVSGSATLELSSWSATATEAHAGKLKFQKSGTATVNTFTAGDHTTAGEILGRIEAWGVDDADGATLSSYIEFANDAVSDADSSPGKIIFATSDADDAGTPTVRMTLDDGGDVLLHSTGKLYFNDAGGEHISGDGDDLTIVAGTDLALDGGSFIKLYDDTVHYGTFSKAAGDTLSISSSAGNITLQPNTDHYIKLGGGTGFTQTTASFDATDTDIDFRDGNKQILTLTADIVDVHFQFPDVSGNFLCIFLQDGTGGWDVSYWKTKNEAGSAGTGNSGVVKWAGGSATTLTEAANKADIISIYWDATNEMAYAVASENF